MKRIPLSPLKKGFFTIVDDEDFEYLNKWKWSFAKEGYAYRSKYANGKSTYYGMARVIMNAPKNMQVDHINHNSLDNRKENLRIVTVSQNQANRKMAVNNKSGFKGVFWDNRDKRWHAVLKVNGKGIYLGVYTSIIAAAKAYDKAAFKHFGVHALLNEKRGIEIK